MKRLDPRGLAAGLGLLAMLNTPPARTQPLPPSPATLSVAAMPVRVVCIADSADAFLSDETFRDRVLAPLAAGAQAAASTPAPSPTPTSTPAGDRVRLLREQVLPLGGRFVVPLGSGFVVDPERRHVVSSWHVATACTSPRSGERAPLRQVGIVEGESLLAVAAERLPDRTFQDASGRPVKLVQALCRNPQDTCSADLPRGPDDALLNEALRRRQLDNLLAYAPDLAVLRLPAPAQALPLQLALHQTLDDQMRLVVRGFAATATAVSLPVVYTGPHQISHLPQGGQPEDEVHAKLHRLAGPLQAAQAGAPVLRGAGVVGVLMTLFEAPAAVGSPSPARASYAVPVTVLAAFLNLLKVPYVAVAADAPPRADPPPALPVPAPVRTGGSNPQHLMIGGALLLAAVAAVAYAVLSRRNARRLDVQAPAPRTTTRVNPTLLHAVAMPTSALEPTPSGPPPVGVRLRCSRGPLAPAVFSLPMPNGGTTLYVGRDPKSCQVVFPAAADQVSGVHACFTWDDASRGLSLRDLSSSGTWLNGERLAQGRTQVLAHGDRVDLGGPDLNRFTVDIPARPEDPGEPPFHAPEAS